MWPAERVIGLSAWARRSALLAAVLASGVGALVLASVPASAAAPSDSSPYLSVSTAHSSFRPGVSVPLNVTVSNRSSAACGLAGVADGSLLVTSATRNGVSLVPSNTDAEYLDGASGVIAGHFTTVAPGRSVTFASVGAAPGTIEEQSPVSGGSQLITSWSIATAGTYRFSLAYEVSPLAGDKACSGESNPVAVAFRIGAPRSRQWLIVGIGVGVGVALLVLLIGSFLVRRRNRIRRRRSLGSAGAITVVIALGIATVALPVLRAAPAFALTGFNPGTGSDSSSNTADFSTCVGRINKFDPSLFPSFNRPGVSLTINAGPYGLGTRTTWGSASPDTTVWWDPNYRDQFADGVIADPCASLFHELTHARDHDNGTLSKVECDGTGIEDDEVFATLAENSYRKANGLLPRESYGPDALPSSMAACTPPPSLLTKIKAWINGDPHVMTFDGQHYDFQAVGEFTAVTSATGDLTVQVRQAAFQSSRTVAVNSALAMNVSGTRLGFYLADGVIDVHRDGAAAGVAAGTTALTGGATLEQISDPNHGAEYVVTWADGTTVSVWRASVYGLVVTIAPSPNRAKTLSGLLGNFDGDPKNDVELPGGKVITPTFASLYPAYADAWRVTSATSLFDYASGTNTTTFTDRSFPSKPVTAGGLTSAQRNSALMACTIAGVTDPTDLADCELDVALTGSVAFAISAGDIAQSRFPGPATPAVGSSGSSPPASSAGQTTTATVSPPNTVAHVRFTGTRGQRVHVQVLSTTLPTQCGVVALHGPDDNVLATGCTKPGDAIDGFLLPSNGEYDIYVDPTGGAVGQITLDVSLSQDQIVATTIGGSPVTATIAAPGDQAQITFPGTAGQKIFVNATDVSLPDQCALQLAGPTDYQLALGCIANKSGYIDGTVLPTTGTYTMTLDPAGESTGSATVTVIEDHDQHLQTTVGGSAVTATVAQPGAVSDVTFPGTAGETIAVKGSASTQPHQCDISVVAPGQSILKLLCDEGDSGPLGTITLPVSGTYTLVLDPSDRGIGQLDLMIATAN